VQSTGQIGIAGMVILGGVITAVIVTALYAQQKRISIPKLVDTVSPSLALGIAIGRLGCFFNGCCFGKTCHLPWAMSFPSGSIAHYVVGNLPVHPTQLYESIYCLIIFITLLLSERKNRFYGFNGALFLTMYSIFRFFNEMFRFYEGSESGMILFNMGKMALTFSQIVSLAMFLGGIIIIIIGNRSVKIAQR
jgi:phosphatidylglycerol:prolipoprotein diacylglycerol transferase